MNKMSSNFSNKKNLECWPKEEFKEELGTGRTGGEGVKEAEEEGIIHWSGSMPLTTKLNSRKIFTAESQVFTPEEALRQVDGGPFEMLNPFMSDQSMISLSLKVSGRLPRRVEV